MVGLIIIELPRFTEETIYMHFKQINIEHEARINLPNLKKQKIIEQTKKEREIKAGVGVGGLFNRNQSSPNVIQRKFDGKDKKIEDKKNYLDDIVIVRDHKVFCSYNKIGNIPEPVEDKYRQLSFNMDPSLEEAKKLQSIISKPLTYQFTEEDVDLLWNYRKYLSNNGKALKKFIAAIRWNNEIEKNEALRLLNKWKDVPPTDAIEILKISKEAPPEIYLYAVQLLLKLDNLHHYLLELIQALKYDYSFLEQQIQKQQKNFTSASSASSASSFVGYPLFDILVEKCYSSKCFCNDFYWFLKAEISGKETLIYKKFLDLFKERLSSQENGKSLLSIFDRQENFLSILSDIHQKSKHLSIDDHKNVLLATLKNKFNSIFKDNPLPSPIDPNILITGFLLNKCSVKKSEARPYQLFCSTTDPSTFHVLLYKRGDDLRQDLFFLQMLRFIDLLYKSENFDLFLSPYRVLSTTRDEGLIEFVPNSTTIYDIVQDSKGKPYNHNISNYLNSFNPPHPTNPNLIHPDVLDIFTRSCAGYCVITYLFGVGDRHLHNVMIQESGRFFHIDFGFLFGKDPKLGAPPFKLPKYVVDILGNIDSDSRFASYCYEAFNRVRSVGSMILALTSLMTNANLDAFDGVDGMTTIEEVCIFLFL